MIGEFDRQEDIPLADYSTLLHINLASYNTV